MTEPEPRPPVRWNLGTAEADLSGGFRLELTTSSPVPQSTSTEYTSAAFDLPDAEPIVYSSAWLGDEHLVSVRGEHDPEALCRLGLELRARRS